MVKYFCPADGKPAEFMDYGINGELIIECSKCKRQWEIEELLGEEKLNKK